MNQNELEALIQRLGYCELEYQKNSYLSTEKFEAIKQATQLIKKQNNKIQKAIDFINDYNNYFEDGENWQNVLKIKEILEEN